MKQQRIPAEDTSGIRFGLAARQGEVGCSRTVRHHTQTTLVHGFKSTGRVQKLGRLVTHTVCQALYVSPLCAFIFPSHLEEVGSMAHSSQGRLIPNFYPYYIIEFSTALKLRRSVVFLQTTLPVVPKRDVVYYLKG